MLKIDRTDHTFARLLQKPLSEAAVRERGDLQRMIANSPEAFFAELQEEFLLIGEELQPSERVEDRIDLLALARDGATVVIELKRGAHKLQLLQALSYAAMVSDWDFEKLVAARARLGRKPDTDAEEEMEEFLSEELSTVNQTQRVLLIAEDFDFEVLATAKWLTEKYDVDVACWSIKLATDSAAEYLSLACIYPPPELGEAARKRRTHEGPRPLRWPDWETALASISNPAVVSFYKERISQGWPSRLPRRMLLFDSNGKRRFWMSARGKHAYVWQRGRFDSDETFWRERLGDTCRIDPVADGRALR
jgi:hypothetical protein